MPSSSSEMSAKSATPSVNDPSQNLTAGSNPAGTVARLLPGTANLATESSSALSEMISLRTRLSFSSSSASMAAMKGEEVPLVSTVTG